MQIKEVKMLLKLLLNEYTKILLKAISQLHQCILATANTNREQAEEQGMEGEMLIRRMGRGQIDCQHRRGGRGPAARKREKTLNKGSRLVLKK